jgi:hypothetical protein
MNIPYFKDPYPPMQKLTSIHITGFLLLGSLCWNASAQDYVLTARGDSLAGEVKPLLYGPQQKVQVVSGKREKTTFALFDIREYSKDGEIFRPLKGEKGYVFMKLLQPGYLALYAFQQDNQARFDGLLLKKLDGDQLIVPNLGFKKYISQFLEDCPEVVERIKGGGLNKKNLPELVEAYNACVNDRTVDHKKEIAEYKEENASLSHWDSLEEKVKGKEFNEKSNALEMIAEIKNKIRGHEKIPNFLIEGLKNSLEGVGLTADLDDALRETGNDSQR